MDERGPWSANPFPNSTITHWKLDKSEDGWRRRQKLRRNYHFDEKLCNPSSTMPSNEALPSTNDSKSGFGANIPEQMKRFLLKGIQKITEEGSSEPTESKTESGGPKVLDFDDSSDQQYPDKQKDSSVQENVQDRKEYPSSTESENSEVRNEYMKQVLSLDLLL